MSSGRTSFIHEGIIYDYLAHKLEEKTLRLRHVFSKGKLLGKAKWKKVEDIKTIIGTSFPDLKGIKLQGEEYRSAEVKFKTSLFNYHKTKKYKRKFNEFAKKDGFIIVAAHDYLPDNLITKKCLLDIYQLEIDDFVTYCRANFARLLNNQIKDHGTAKIWLMYQGGNFNKGEGKILPARESNIWCPTDNLTGFDITKDDYVLFIKTGGIDRIKIQNKFLKEDVIHEKWKLIEICITRVKSKIFSRQEYLQFKGFPETKQLWRNDGYNKKKKRRWGRVFEFEIIKEVETSILLNQMFSKQATKTFVQKMFEVLCYTKSRELTHREYQSLLESLI